MTRYDSELNSTPVEVPLAHPQQDFSARHHDAEVPVWKRLRGVWRMRVFTLLTAAAITVGVAIGLGDWLGEGRLSLIEAGLIGLVCFTFFWICFGVCSAALGLMIRFRQPPRPAPDAPSKPLKVALVVPIYHEDADAVMGNAGAMLADLSDRESEHSYELFALSDSQNPDIIASEQRAFRILQRDAALPAWYRRRENNTDRKTGNLSDWVARWGGRYDAMIVLDADSLMSAEALDGLACEMARDPSAGLIQSLPRLIGARSLFARLQQFSSAAYGWLLAEGLAAWAGQEGNYWGHNAIIRTRAFALCAGLPRLKAKGKGEGKLIMSHDFVEAGLLRRSGWAVRFLPRIAGSYEESPTSLVDYALRDRRWCHGNLQHLRLLCAKGFHPVSRFHLFAGAMAYLMSPAWFALLVVWALLGRGEDANVISYFSPENPLMPNWPEITGPKGLGMLIFMYVMLLAPKLMAAGALALTGTGYRAFGGIARFWGSFILEIFSAIALAPVLMIQQLLAVLRATFGLSGDWQPQRREGGSMPVIDLVRFHLLETILGFALVAGLFAGLISLWLIPIAASLALAVPLSWLSALDLGAWHSGKHMLLTPEMTEEPRIVTMARQWRARMKPASEKGWAAE
ncbi:membrane glycosyltransferase [Palleronia aestuarii]|uniref:Glucans biosynthesis glucosyltransferase H n=1 Tax=Palleronia aestuarii TaxID=568105 RepID=A0A2W7N832_9RHOB|nr:glucans biosynthesis glucosyltransferase MdoH [Palleronia aestuarii]PZX16575.1 membrane glycosyltransferase [Palleronia aestuarii]